MPTSNISIGTPPFLGREQELQQLLDAYHGLYNGDRSAVVVLGEIGMGKTRLLDEFCRCSLLDRAFLVRLRFFHEERIEGAVALEEALAEALEARPALRRQLETGPNGFGTGKIEPGRAFGIIARRLPLVLIIDDCDAADETFDVEFATLLRGMEQPLLLIATGSPSSQEHLAELCRRADLEYSTLLLAPFDETALAAHVEAQFGEEPGPEDRAWLAEATRGLPILMRDAFHALLRSGCIAMREGAWRLEHPFSRCRFAPTTAMPLLSIRLAELPELSRRALAVLSVLGVRAPHHALVELGFPEEWYAPLVGRDILKLDGAFVEFSHDLLFEAALAEAHSSDVMEQMHTALVQLLTGDEGKTVRFPGKTLRALRNGAGPEERATIWEAMLEAAFSFTRNREYFAALSYFREAYAWWKESGGEGLPERSGALINTYAEVLFQLGYVAEQQMVLEGYLGRYETEPPSPDLAYHVVRAMLYRVEYLARRKQFNEALALLERAEGILPLVPSRSGEPLHASLMLMKAKAFRYVDRYIEAKEFLFEIMVRWDGQGLKGVIFDAYLALHSMHKNLMSEERERVIGWQKQLLELCEQEGNHRAAVQIRSHILGEIWATEPYERTGPLIRSLIEETQRLALPRTESNAWYWLSAIEANRGNYGEAIRLVRKVVEIRRRVQSIALWQVAVMTQAQILTYDGRDREALEVLDELEADARQHGRPYRKFVVEFCRRIINARRGGWKREQERIGELRSIAENEPSGFDYLHAELEVESEILLAAPAVDIDRAETFATRVLQYFDTNGVQDVRLPLMTVAVLGKSTRRRSGTLPQVAVDAAAVALDVLARQHKDNAPYNVAFGVGMIRRHALHLFAPESLTPYILMASTVESESTSYNCRISAFGRLRVLDIDGRERGGRHFGTQKSDSKPRKVLAALAVGTVLGRGLSRERLIDMVWGDGVSAETAANNFHVTLSVLRRVVGESGIRFSDAEYSLDSRSVHLDVAEFLRLLEQGEEADRKGLTFPAFDLLNRACALSRGEFLEGIYDEWVDGPRDILRARSRRARLRLADLALARGEQDLARREIRAMLEADATDEEAMYRRLQLLRAEGSRLQALREYEEFNRLLHREYGVEPSAALRELREIIAAD